MIPPMLVQDYLLNLRFAMKLQRNTENHTCKHLALEYSAITDQLVFMQYIFHLDTACQAKLM